MLQQTSIYYNVAYREGTYYPESHLKCLFKGFLCMRSVKREIIMHYILMERFFLLSSNLAEGYIR